MTDLPRRTALSNEILRMIVILAVSDCYSLAQIAEAFEQIRDVIHTEGRPGSASPLQDYIAFIRSLNTFGYRLGQKAKHVSLLRLSRDFDTLRFHRQLGALVFRSTLIIAPIEAGTADIQLEDGHILMCTDNPAIGGTGRSIFTLGASSYIGDHSFVLANAVPSLVLPSAHKVAFSVARQMIAVVGSAPHEAPAVRLFRAGNPSPYLEVPLPLHWPISQATLSDCHCRLDLFDNFCALFIPRPSALIVFNSQNGNILVVAEGAHLGTPESFAFLTPREFALCGGGVLSLYRVPLSLTPLERLACTSLTFPAARDGAKYTSSKMYSPQGDTGTRAKFVSKERLLVFMITVGRTRPNLTCDVLFFAKASSLAALCVGGTGDRGWDEWGPHSCRGLALGHGPMISKGAVCGLRAVIQQRLTSPTEQAWPRSIRTVTVDFGDLQNMLWTDRIQPIVRGATRGAIPGAGCIPLPAFFKDDITTYVPFSYTISPARLYPATREIPSLMLDDAHLVEVYSNDEMQQSIEMDVFAL